MTVLVRFIHVCLCHARPKAAPGHSIFFILQQMMISTPKRSLRDHLLVFRETIVALRKLCLFTSKVYLINLFIKILQECHMPNYSLKN